MSNKNICLKLTEECVRLREMLGISSADLARKIKRSSSMISKFENNHNQYPSLKTYRLYLDALGYKLNITLEPKKKDVKKQKAQKKK